tara:strand:- start:463 stop:732 length:270 start_codon:yes stop_codon:yes gene_type:complete
MKTSISVLNILVTRINDLVGASEEPYTNRKANIGNYHLDWAYGGVQLHRMSNERGAIRVISHDGYSTKPKMDSCLRHIITGLELASESK